jgi:hypothetical protein
MNMEDERAQMAPRLSDIFNVSEKSVRKYQEEIEQNEGFNSVFNKKSRDLKEAGVHSGTTSTLDAQTMYTVCRIIEPDVVVETGVRYGSFDAHITAALEKNKNGMMYCIDLPDAIDKYEYGYLVPEEFRSRWELRLGDAKEILPDLLSEVEPVDLFLHDSLHTRDHMKWEYETAYPQIANKGVLASHDVLKNNVFQNFANENGMKWKRIRNFGAARKLIK